MFQSISALCLLIALAGQDQAFARYYQDKTNKSKLALDSYKISTLIWLVLFVILYFSSEWTSEIFFGEVNKHAMLMVGLVSLPLSYLRLSEQIYRMKSETKNYGVQQITVNFVTRLLVLISAFIDKEYNTYITTYSIITILLTFYFILKQIKLKNITLSTRFVSKDLFSFGMPNMFAAVIYSLKDFIPRVVLINYTTLYNVGIYSAAISLASFLNILQAGFSTYYLPYFYENYRNDNGKFEKIHHALTFILVTAAMTLTLFKDLIVYVLGNEYSSAAIIMPIILWSPVALAISETTVYGINIFKKVSYHTYIAIFTTIITVIFSFLLVPKYEELGAAFAIGLSGIVFLILRTYYGFKFLKTVNNIYKTIFSLIIMIFFSTIISLLDVSFNLSFYLYIVSLTILILIYKTIILELIRRIIKRRV